MAPKKLPWFRFHVEALADVKLRRMKPEHRWLWVAILGTARTSPMPGFLMISEAEPHTPADLADIAALPERSVAEGLRLMERAQMIEMDTNLLAWRVTNWERRQFASDTSTARVKEHRKRSDATPEAPSMERSIDVPVTPPETDTETDTPSSSLRTTHDPAPNDNDAAGGGPGEPVDHDQLVRRTANLVGHAVAASKAATNPGGYARTVTAGIMADDGNLDQAGIRVLLSQGLTPEAIAEAWQPDPLVGLGSRPQPPAPGPDAAGHYAANEAARREQMAHQEAAPPEVVRSAAAEARRSLGKAVPA